MYKKGFKLKSIISSLKKGNTVEEACRQAGINQSTLWKWRQKEDRIDGMIYRAIESRIQLVEDALFNSAIKGVPAAQIFFLKNRKPDRWKDTRGAVNNHIAVSQTNNNGSSKPRGEFDGEDAATSERLTDYLRNSLKQL